MPKEIKVGDKFECKCAAGVEFERVDDDPCPVFECERMRVKAIHPKQDQYAEYTFGAEPEWFHQRGLVAYPEQPKPQQLTLFESSIGDASQQPLAAYRQSCRSSSRLSTTIALVGGGRLKRTVPPNNAMKQMTTGRNSPCPLVRFITLRIIIRA